MTPSSLSPVMVAENGTIAAWHSEPLAELPVACVVLPESLYIRRQRKKFFLVSKVSCFADSQSLLCEIDSWVCKSFLFPSSLYVTNLILYFGFNTATKEGICLQLAIASLACLSQQLCFVSRNVKSAASGQEVAGIAMETDFFFPAQLRNCVTRLLQSEPVHEQVADAS